MPVSLSSVGERDCLRRDRQLRRIRIGDRHRDGLTRITAERELVLDRAAVFIDVEGAVLKDQVILDFVIEVKDVDRSGNRIVMRVRITW